MLKSINIENIAVIEKCNIDFCDGFNVLTGETGAGKSIIIDSINAVTGQRTSKEIVRTGSEKALVSAVFDDISSIVVDKLEEYGIECDDKSVMLVRTITADGKNTCRINGVLVNVSVMRDICSMLINIHGQHDNQALLNSDNHLGFIDNYGNYSNILEDYRDCYSKLRSVRKSLKSLTLDEDEKQRRIDLLKYQINEITAANIKENELQELINRRDLIRNSEKLMLSLKMCSAYLSGDDNSSGAESLSSQALIEFSKSAKILKNSEQLLARLDFAVSEIADISSEIRDLSNNVAFDANELEALEERILLLNSLNKKYGGNESAVLQFLENAKYELDSITVSEDKIKELEKQSDELEDMLVIKASALTDARKKTALEFSDKVCEILRYLEMPNVVFLVDIDKKIYTVDGCDKLEFLISANLGQDTRPLAKIASGGELSRIMLAIKSIMTAKNDAETLIFDEIDTGISGKAADKVGRQLKELSNGHQVLCVTHLAQIAAAADNHYLISKSSTINNTYTNVQLIEGHERIGEIARIMSGTNMTENLYNSAKELIDNHKHL